ncbi:glutamine-hydrolyzing GMP synthase [bacterium]|nr:glutamine-hydrolyzing GMP synthase [bacterium]
MDLHSEKIIVLDFGSQYSQLIARKVRENRVYCEILPYNTSYDEIKRQSPKGIILSGGPHSVYEPDAPLPEKRIMEGEIPILGICYGMQLLAYMLGGKVLEAQNREYGHAKLLISDYSDLFYGFQQVDHQVWMSHADRVVDPPAGFVSLASTQNSCTAAMKQKGRPVFGVQFHPEVAHTPEGNHILQNFIFRICGCRSNWTMSSFIGYTIKDIREKVGDAKVICALSGGVDSSVTALIMHKAVGRQLTCVFVNNGLLRMGEEISVRRTFEDHFQINLVYVNAQERFLSRLAGVADPEKKRKIIGNEFIFLFEEEARKIQGVEFLAQGTLYPDVIESVSVKGPSATIKSHHNVGGLPEKMNLRLIEPLRELFKDEVRMVGRELGLPEEIINRQPFPGPGLAIRVLGDVTESRLEILRQADVIVLKEIKDAGLYERIWQSFAVLLPVRTVGVMGDLRTYDHVVAIRAVTSQDGMTADWVRLPYELIGRISNRIINEVKGVNRVVYDVSSKPPSTIEWE